MNCENRTLINKGFSFCKSRRLLTSRDFSAVFDDSAVKAAHPQLLILAKPNQLNEPRLGMVIAKKNLRLAVNRNRLKRLIRESFRAKHPYLPPIDAIVLARRGTEHLSNEELFEILNQLWNRAAKRAIGLQTATTQTREPSARKAPPARVPSAKGG